MRRIATTFFLVLGGLAITTGMPGPLLAQWETRAGIYAARDSNPLGLYGTPDASALVLTAGTEYETRRLGWGYFGSLTEYNQQSDLNAYVHQTYLGLGSQKTSLNFLAEQRLGTYSNLYNYVVARSNMVLQFGCLGMNCLWQGGGSVYRFTNLPDRNHNALHTSLKANRSFQTGTTIIATAAAGYSVYSGSSDLNSEQQPGARVTNLSGTVRLAQSLSATTGSALYMRARHLSGAEPGTYVDEITGISFALLDDPSLYSARAVGFELTRMLLDYDVTVKAGGSYELRDYPSHGTYTGFDTFDAFTARSDRRTTLWMLTSWDVSIGERPVTIEIGAHWIKNISNSYWYDYSGSYLSVGLEYGF